MTGYLCKQQNDYVFTQKDFLEIPLQDQANTTNTPEGALLGDIPFVFHHFDTEDSSKAIYVVSNEEQQEFLGLLSDLGSKPEDHLVEKLKQLPQKGDGSQEEEKTIFIGQARAGGGGPGEQELTKDTEALQISVDWREMLTKYFQAQGGELHSDEL